MRRSAPFAAALFFIATASQALPSIESSKLRNGAAITSDLQTSGKSRIIVTFNLAKSPLVTKADFAARASAVRKGQDAILSSALGSVQAASANRGFSRMRIQPMFAISADSSLLAKLAADSRVTRIYRDGISKPTLAQSVPLIGGDKLQAKGGTGEGFIVAIIDTGVERTHDFIKNRVIDGACFASNDEGYTSTCKDAKTDDQGKKAGNPCTQSGDCLHGTHVAGIAAGSLKHKAAHPGEPLVGVAPKASIIAINVFSYSPIDGLGAFDSDIEKGLEYVYEHRTDYAGLNIASANMSLGDGTDHATNCDDEDVLTGIVEDLRAANIATAIASGNEARRNGVAAPGCISAAITVGATTKTDVIASFSNQGDLVDVLAPGAAIRSSVVGNVFGTLSGTSMATPHVTGTWAALRSLHPDATVDQIEAALEKTGKTIKDTRTGGTISKPRIQIDKADKAIKG